MQSERKVIPEPSSPQGGADMPFLNLSQTPVYTAREQIQRQCIAWCACRPNFHWYSLRLPRRDCQAELPGVAGYTRWFTHPSTNRARRRLTPLIGHKAATVYTPQNSKDCNNTTMMTRNVTDRSRTMVMSGELIDLMMFGALRCVRP